MLQAWLPHGNSVFINIWKEKFGQWFCAYTGQHRQENPPTIHAPHGVQTDDPKVKDVDDTA
jgi:hypothetical protein